jgi:uncharacterized protein (DUF1697 family)
MPTKATKPAKATKAGSAGSGPAGTTRYAAMLRGVNVGGNKKIAMADLRALLTGLGHDDVGTLLQSGNAVFSAPETDPGQLAAQIESALAADLGLKSRVLVRTHADLAAVIEANPFPTAEQEPSKHLVQFLFAPLTPATRARIGEFDAAPFAPEEFRVGDGVIYFRFPDGMGRSKLDAAFGKHVTAKLEMTGRNWNTVRKLHDLTG